MSYTQQHFAQQALALTRQFKWQPNAKPELQLMSTAVKADTATHDRTIDAPTGILLNPNSYFQQALNRLINRGFGGNLTGAQMGAALDAAYATLP
jgi:hypothetical protein